jgi:membrane-bound serine protease (ClpP class)
MKLNRFLIVFFVLSVLFASAQEENNKIVYKLNIKSEITPATRRHVSQAFSEARECNADLVLIHMNTYGGTVVDADSIRTQILQSKIPVYVFIDNNAASAGALISIACDGIYMRPGGSIGAATVVNQNAEAMPDKYQSYMRSMMRSTCQAHGGDTTITAEGDTIVNWFRDPKIAEAMVDQSLYIEGISDTGKVITFTPSEAMKYGFCEGTAESVDEVLTKLGVDNYNMEEYLPSFVEKIIGFLVHPMISGLLIMAIIGGIYFEMQSPGIGFPLAVAVLAAVLYFMPLYLEGLAANWEIALFVLGVILTALEVFVIPGFGVAGITGISFIFVGLVLSLINNVHFNFEGVDVYKAAVAVMVVIIGVIGGFASALLLGKLLFSAEKGMFSTLALKTVQNTSEGYVSILPEMLKLKGRTGVAYTVLRPGGKVKVDDDIYDAVAENGFIDQAEQVVVTRVEATQLYVDYIEAK